MPSPLGHAIGGLVVGLLLAPTPRGDGRRPDESYEGHDVHESHEVHEAHEAHEGYRVGEPDRRTASLDRVFVAWCVAAACLPDIDFAWGRHNMETHSIGFAVLVGIVVWAWRRSARLAIACVVAAGTHVLFDWLGSDDFPPLGVMALWPLSHAFYFAEAYVFQTISRRYWLPGFFMHNLLAVAREVAILAPPAAVVYWFRRSR